jgi:hypothetical protein
MQNSTQALHECSTIGSSVRRIERHRILIAECRAWQAARIGETAFDLAAAPE